MKVLTLHAIARLWSQVDVGWPGECWPYRGALGTDGYGAFKLAGATLHASRAAYMAAHPEVELTDADLVCHHCDNPPCCNPGHLFLGSAADNMADMRRKGRTRGVAADPRSAQLIGAATKHRRAVEERLPRLLAAISVRLAAGESVTYRSVANLDGYWSARQTLSLTHSQIVAMAREVSSSRS